MKPSSETQLKIMVGTKWDFYWYINCLIIILRMGGGVGYIDSTNRNFLLQNIATMFFRKRRKFYDFWIRKTYGNFWVEKSLHISECTIAHLTWHFTDFHTGYTGTFFNHKKKQPNCIWLNQCGMTITELNHSTNKIEFSWSVPIHLD